LKESYTWVADLFSRPHYINLKQGIALKYKDHTIQMVHALNKLDPVEVVDGNLHGVKAVLLVLDLITKLQHKAPAFQMTNTLKEKFVSHLAEFLDKDESCKFRLCGETRALLL